MLAHESRQPLARLTCDARQNHVVSCEAASDSVAAPVSKVKSKNFRTEIYFVGGKMKRRKIPLIDGMEVDEFIRRNADDSFLVQEGYFHLLHEREQLRKMPNH